MRTGIVFTILFCGASAGFAVWRVYEGRIQEAPQFEIVQDPSISYKEGCQAVVGWAEQAMQAKGISSKSRLNVLVIGDKSTANEPWQLGEYSIPASRKVMEGRSSIQRQQQDVLNDLLSRCKQVRPTTISPIFLGLKQAVADLRSRGCPERSRCVLFVDSDLEENVEQGIKDRLDNVRGDQHALPLRLNNSQIDIVFCGLAATAGQIVIGTSRRILETPPRDAGREDRLQETWRLLFTNPELVRFEPYCPKPSGPGGHKVY